MHRTETHTHTPRKTCAHHSSHMPSCNGETEGFTHCEPQNIHGCTDSTRTAHTPRMSSNQCLVCTAAHVQKTHQHTATHTRRPSARCPPCLAANSKQLMQTIDVCHVSTAPMSLADFLLQRPQARMPCALLQLRSQQTHHNKQLP